MIAARAGAAILALLGLPAPGFAQATSLTVVINGVESNEGQVYVGLCPKSFEEAECVAGRRQKARAGTMRVTFTDVPPGRYAIAAYHDVNGNGRLDKQTFGLPAEPYGFSNDVGRFAPPSFSGALVPVGPGATTISLRFARMKLTP